MHIQKRIPSFFVGICLVAAWAPALSAQLTIGFGPDLGTSSVGPYNFPLTATGGTPPYTWSLTSGSLPAGLHIRSDVPTPLPDWWPANASAGIVGVATIPQFTPGASFMLKVTDAAGQSYALACTLKILPLTILDTSQLPDGFVNAAYRYGLTPGNANGSVTWAVPAGSDPLPSGLELDATTGEIRGTPATAGFYNFQIAATDSNGTSNGKHFTLNVPAVGFATSGALGNVNRGSFFGVSLSPTGGTAPYSFSGDGLPPGLTLTSDGFLSGTVSGGNGTHHFNLTVSDHSGGTYSKQFALNIMGSSRQPVNLNHAEKTLDMALGEPNSHAFSATGGLQPYDWSINGSLPPGLRLRTVNTSPRVGPLNAEIVGTPTQVGSYTFNVVLTDGGGATVSQPLTIHIRTLTVDSPPSGTRGQPYTFYIRPVGDHPAYHWSTSDGTGRLPSGLVLDSSTGVISGTPLENGNFDVTVEIDTPLDAGGQTTLRSLNITINSPSNPRISSSVPGRLADASTDVPVTYNTNFCCGSGSLAYSWTGTTPAGLNLNLATGEILGTPTTPGQYRFTVTATDSADSSNMGVREFFLIVSPRRPDQTVNLVSNKGNAPVHSVSEPVSVRNSATTSSRGPVNSAIKTPVSNALGVALNFVPITPCRVADTRNPTGPFGGPAIAGNSSRDFNIPSSACGVPSTAQAYSLNVAVVPSGPLGFLTLWPTGQPQPFVSTLNSVDGRIKSNAAIVAAGTSGSISVFAATSATDLILDINGYFVPATDPSGLAFYPVTPCRIADTRNAVGPLGGPSMGAGQSRTFPILSSTCNLPATAQAYSLNFAAVPPGPLGFLTAWPTGQAKPLVATLNAPTGTVVGNAAIVPAGTNGSIDVFASGATDMVIDINGYFAPAGAGGLSLYGVTPCRVVDTRVPAGSPPVTSLDVGVSSSGCGIPAGAQAYVMSATVVPPGILGFLTLWPQGQTRPLVATLNAQDGSVTSNMAIVPTVNGSISAFASNPTHLILDISGYFAPVTVGTGTITVSSATVGVNLEDAITITFNPALPVDTTLTITSGNPAAVLVGNSGSVGKAQLQTLISAGTTTLTTTAQALTNTGAVIITASAAGYTSGTGTITLGNSGFVISGPNGIGASFTTFEGVTTALTVNAALLDSNRFFVKSQSVAGGQSFNVSIAASPVNLGTLATNPVPFPGGTSSVSVNFVASPSVTQTGSVSLTQPATFTNPVIGGSVSVNVQTSGLIAPTLTVGNNLQAPATVTLNGPTPTDTTVTITSSDSTKLAFSKLAGDQTRVGAITITIPAGQTSSVQFFVRAYASSGSIPYTISSPSYGTVNASMPLGPSGLAISLGSQGGLGSPFNISVSGSDGTLFVWTALVDNTGAPIALQSVAADQSISAAVTSGTPSVGTITTSPVVISGNSANGTTTFHPLTTGTSTITASATGYSSGTIQATVKSCNVTINNGLTVGQFLEAQGGVNLSCAAGAGGVPVQLTSNSPNVKLALSPTDPGSNSITVTVGSGFTTATYYVYALASSGSGTYSASASNYTSGPNDTVFFAPSGVVIVESIGTNPPNTICSGTCNVPLAGGAVSLTAFSYQLSTDGQNTLVGTQPVMGSASVTVPLGNTNSSAGTLSPGSAIFTAGSYFATVTFTPKATGSTTVSVTQPPGWTTPALVGGTNVTQIGLNVQ